MSIQKINQASASEKSAETGRINQCKDNEKWDRLKFRRKRKEISLARQKKDALEIYYFQKKSSEDLTETIRLRDEPIFKNPVGAFEILSSFQISCHCKTINFCLEVPAILNFFELLMVVLEEPKFQNPQQSHNWYFAPVRNLWRHSGQSLRHCHPSHTFSEDKKLILSLPENL